MGARRDDYSSSVAANPRRAEEPDSRADSRVELLSGGWAMVVHQRLADKNRDRKGGDQAKDG